VGRPRPPAGGGGGAAGGGARGSVRQVGIGRTGQSPSTVRPAHPGSGDLSGAGGIRTLDTVSRIRHFQCRLFNHSSTAPSLRPTDADPPGAVRAAAGILPGPRAGDNAGTIRGMGPIDLDANATAAV